MGEYEKNGMVCKGIHIKNMEELKQHFCIEEMMKYYDNKYLHMWLAEKGYSYELWRVSNIVSEKPDDIAKELLQIFQCETDK